MSAYFWTPWKIISGQIEARWTFPHREPDDGLIEFRQNGIEIFPKYPEKGLLIRDLEAAIKKEHENDFTREN